MTSQSNTSGYDRGGPAPNNCYIKFDWCCPDKPVKAILDYAQKTYTQDKYDWGPCNNSKNNKPWQLGNGKYNFEEKTVDKRKDLTCYWMVANVLSHLKYHVKINNRCAPNGTRYSGIYVIDLKYYCKIDYEDAGPGDIVMFPFHIGIMAGKGQGIVEGDYFSGDEYWGFNLFESTNKGKSGPQVNFCANSRTHSRQSSKGEWMGVTGFYRPKEKCGEKICKPFPKVRTAGPAFHFGDPLVIALDSEGITTVGKDEGAYFDFNADGFHEKSGWIGDGSGFLMLDLNENGRLDDGSELFGEFTKLPTGENAANGFQALAQYDDNLDGRIDVNDAIWSQLGVYYDTSGYTPQSAGGG